MKAIIFTAVFCVAAVNAFAQDQLSAARDLYASASYEEALSVLTRIHNEPAAAPVSATADQYRAFCLFALGRTAEANAVVEALITANPQVAVESDASPRIAAMFTDARKRLLPTIVRDRYRAARAAMDKKDFASAEPQLVKVRALVDEAMAAGVADETLADLKVLVDGFLDLARAGTARAANETAAARPDREAAPIASAVPTKAREPQIFDSTARDVTAPVSIRQELPSLPNDLAKLVEQTSRNGVLELLIDEKGSVERAVIRESVLPLYDNLLLTSAKNWKYQPALRAGTPVKYVKVIAVNVKAASAASRPQ